MTRKDKPSQPLKSFRVRGLTDHALRRLPDGKPVVIQAYTPKAAKHRAKAMCGANVSVEVAS